MAAMSDWAEQNVLDHSLNSNALGADISPTSVYVSLHTADPTDTDGNEVSVSGRDYARVQMTAGWTAATSAGVTTARNTGAITFPQETQLGYGPVTHFGIHDASTAGNMMFHGSVTPSNTVVNVGDTPSFAATALILEASGAFSDFLELAIFKQMLNDDISSVIDVANVFMALYTTDPLDANTGTEVTNAGSYARIDAGLWVIEGGPAWTAKSPAAGIDFGSATANWGTVTHFGILDSGTHGAGNLFYHGLLTNSKNVNSGDSLTVPEDAITIELR